MIERRLYHYAGRVQGVGFRYTVRSLAKSYPIIGYVKNLPDGRVELCAEGLAADLDQLAADVATKMEGFVKTVTVQEQPTTGGMSGFVIRH